MRGLAVRLLIPTQIHDIHAKVVQRALALRGHEAILWYGGDLPSRQSLGLEVAEDGAAALRIDGVDIADSGAFDVVWLRRPVHGVVPEDMHPGDRAFAVREWDQFMRGLWLTIGEGAFWVNPRQAATLAGSKPRQLVEAARVGFAVPRTLFSNDPARIRAFIRENPGETIYKPFCTSTWRLDDGAAYLFTAVVDEAALPDDDVLRLAPGIFQPRVDKAYELRVTVMGRRVFAVRLASQSLEQARVDWRAGTRAIAMEPVTLPPEVEARCLALLDRLGLVFGCLDFIVTPAGEHVFLEVNQMGQFLWLEELLPELPLLDAFCAMLEQARPDFEWRPEAATLRFADLHDREREAELDAPHVVHAMGYAHDDREREAAA